MSVDQLEILLWASAASLALALGLVLCWRGVNRRRVGMVRWSAQRGRTGRKALLVAALLASAAVVAGSDIGRSAGGLTTLALALALLAVSPGALDTCYGESGVQHGWHARRLGDLEGWRLIGEHLRWKLFGEWVATDVPVKEHPALRARLEQLAPGREAQHGNAGFDPQRAEAAKSKS